MDNLPDAARTLPVSLEIAVSSYQSFAAANQVVGREAATLGTLYRAVSNYPEPIRGELQTMLRDYTR
jgi:hypothetical protein